MIGRLALLALLATGCAAMDAAPGDDDNVADGPSLLAPWPAPEQACVLGPKEPTRLLLTTTDFSTGALTVVDPDALEVTPDVAVASTDAIPFVDPLGGRVVIANRFGLDYLDVWTEPGFDARGQFPVAADMGSANPHGVAFAPDGTAWVTTLGTSRLRRFDLARPPGSAEVETIELSAFADPDGNPEASLVVSCGRSVYVAVQRLDAAFSPVDVDMLVAIDPDEGLPVDLDAETPGGQGLALQGTWLRQLRTDPTDDTGRTLLGLTTGIERIDLDTRTVSWAAPQDAFARAGIGDVFLPQSFAVSADGTTAYVAAYVADFSEVQLYVVGLDGNAPTAPEPFASGLDSVERTLERIGDQLWFGSTRTTAPGLWVYDVSADPPRPIAGPLSTGLPPYSMVALP